MSRPLVSVIVPVYENAAFLDHCLKSITEQTYPELEILCIDDGSGDDSLTICRNWEKKDSRIRVFQQANAGVSVARNKGLDHYQGEWILFVDGDDYLQEDAVETLLKQTQDDVDIVLSDYYVDSFHGRFAESFLSVGSKDFQEEKEKQELIVNCFLRTSLSNRNIVTMIGVPWAKLFRAELIRKNRIRFDERCRKMQDAIFNMEAFHLAGRIRYLKNVRVYNYVQNKISVTHRGNPAYASIAENLLTAMKERIERYDLSFLNGVYQAKRFILALECIKFTCILAEGKTFAEKLKDARSILKKLSFREEEKEQLKPYLGKMHRMAFFLYEKNSYLLLYLFCSLYLFLKSFRSKGF